MRKTIKKPASSAPSTIRDLPIEHRPITSLRYLPQYILRHSQTQIELLAKNIQEFGWKNPLLIDDDGLLCIGNGRLLAASYLGMKTVPTTLVDSLSNEQFRTFVEKDLMLSTDADRDEDLRRLPLKDLRRPDVEFALGLMGIHAPWAFVKDRLNRASDAHF